MEEFPNIKIRIPKINKQLKFSYQNKKEQISSSKISKDESINKSEK